MWARQVSKSLSPGTTMRPSGIAAKMKETKREVKTRDEEKKQNLSITLTVTVCCALWKTWHTFFPLRRYWSAVGERVKIKKKERAYFQSCNISSSSSAVTSLTLWIHLQAEELMIMIYGSCMQHALAQTQSNSFKLIHRILMKQGQTVIGRDGEDVAILSALESKPLQAFWRHMAVGLLLHVLSVRE